MNTGRVTVSSDPAKTQEGAAVNFAVLATLHSLSFRSDADRARNEPLPNKRLPQPPRHKDQE